MQSHIRKSVATARKALKLAKQNIEPLTLTVHLTPTTRETLTRSYGRFGFTLDEAATLILANHWGEDAADCATDGCNTEAALRDILEGIEEQKAATLATA